MIVNLFPTQIYRNVISIASTVLKPLLADTRSILDSEDASHPDLGPKTFSTFNRNNQLQNNPLLEPLVAEINTAIAECWKEFNYYHGLTPFINEMWLNETLPGGLTVVAHNHSPYPLAGVLYLQAEEGMGNIIFENPNNLVVGTQPHNWGGTNEVNGGIQEITKIQTNDIIIFPGWLRHSGEVNNTNMPRYAISFNVGCRGEYPISTYMRKT